MKFIELSDHIKLDDYATSAMLAGPVHQLRTDAAALVPRLQDRRVVMVNSTAQGGGVAEMLPKLTTMLGELGVPTSWAVIDTDCPEFFALTKRLHNMIHGEGRAEFTLADRELYERVNRENARQLKEFLSPDDILVVHDPQPMALGAILKEELGLHTIWRCHIGHDRNVPATRDAWRFLRPYASGYDRGVFTAPEYIPDYFARKATIIHPSIDPFSHKNRNLVIHKIAGVLVNSDLAAEDHPVFTPPFEHRAKRLHPDGTFQPANQKTDIGFLFTPIVTQISRWDRLKGFLPLMDAFIGMKRTLLARKDKISEREFHRITLVKLILAGPDPASIQDDPEGQDVLKELCDRYCSLQPECHNDIALISLPMESRKENALMVNAMQRCSSVIVQNSLREGFGLTVTEAMWKGIPILGSSACGIRQQVRDLVDGRIVRDSTDVEEVARVMEEMLNDALARDIWGRNAQKRVSDEFLIFRHIHRWLQEFVECCERGSD